MILKTYSIFYNKIQQGNNCLKNLLYFFQRKCRNHITVNGKRLEKKMEWRAISKQAIII